MNFSIEQMFFLMIQNINISNTIEWHALEKDTPPYAFIDLWNQDILYLLQPPALIIFINSMRYHLLSLSLATHWTNLRTTTTILHPSHIAVPTHFLLSVWISYSVQIENIFYRICGEWNCSEQNCSEQNCWKQNVSK